MGDRLQTNYKCLGFYKMRLLLEQELFILPQHFSSPPVFSGARVNRSLVLCVCFVDRCLSCFFWSLSCLSFFDLRILITLVISSSSSYWSRRESEQETMTLFPLDICLKVSWTFLGYFLQIILHFSINLTCLLVVSYAY